MKWTAILLFVVAFGVRLVGIGWGLPNGEHYYAYHPDELLILNVSYWGTNPYQGDWLPGYYNYGSLPLNLWSIWLHLLTAWGIISEPSSAGRSEEQTALFYHDLLLWARILVALMGALTVVVVYRMGQKLGGSALALLVAFVMTIAPAHVIHSRFQTVDVPATLFAALTFLASVRLYDSPKPMRELLWGSLWSGCAAGCKYNVGLVLIALLVSLIYRWFRSPDSQSAIRLSSRVGLSIVVGVLTFLMVCPGSWADSEAFWKGFSYELQHVQAGHGLVFAQTGLGWIYHLTPNLTYGFGLLPLLLALVGGGFCWRACPAFRGALLATFAYYLLIGAAQVRFLRYTFPLYPTLAIGIGALWMAASGTRTAEMGKVLERSENGVKNEWWRMDNGSRVVRVLIVLSLLWQSIWMAGLTHCMIGEDPRDQCVEWFRQHVPPGSRVAFAADQWFSRPPLSPSIGYGPAEIQWVQGITGRSSKEVPYVLISLSPPNWHLERLQSEQPDWVLMSEFEFGDAERLNLPEYRRFMEAVRRDYLVEKRFRRQPFLLPKRGLPPHDLMYLYPEIRIYGRDESTR